MSNSMVETFEYELESIDNYVDAVEAVENFLDLYIFNELHGKSAAFTEWDNYVNDATFDEYFDALETTRFTSFDRLGETDSANKVSRVRIKIWVDRLQKIHTNSVYKAKDRPKIAGKAVEWYTSIEDVSADYNTLNKVASQVSKFLDEFENYESKNYSNNEKMDARAHKIAALTKTLNEAYTQVSNTPAKETSPVKLHKGAKNKTIKFDRSKMVTKTLYDLRRETPQFITLLTKYASLMDTMTSLATRAKKVGKYDRKVSKQDLKNLKKSEISYHQKHDLKYSKKSTKVMVKENVSIARYLTVLVAIEMQKLESLMGLYTKVNQKL